MVLKHMYTIYNTYYLCVVFAGSEQINIMYDETLLKLRVRTSIRFIHTNAHIFYLYIHTTRAYYLQNTFSTYECTYVQCTLHTNQTHIIPINTQSIVNSKYAKFMLVNCALSLCVLYEWNSAMYFEQSQQNIWQYLRLLYIYVLFILI